jgi:trimethylamine:corrinoid methyltransferase-like protein
LEDLFERVEEAAIEILEGIGIAVGEEELMEMAVSLGFKERGGRVVLERSVVRRFIEGVREEVEEKREEGMGSGISLGINPYPTNYLSVEADEILPMTTERLVESVKLVDSFAEEGLKPGAPGCPVDVPPPLQPLQQYRIAATYSRHGRYPVEPRNLFALPYLMEMAELLGHPIRSLPVYVFSPLNLSGESLKCVLRARGSISSVSVSSMPSVGSTAPIRIGDALAMALAEVVGSALLIHEVLGIDVYWSVGIFPCDLRSMAMSFGSPEYILFQILSSQLDAYMHGRKWMGIRDGVIMTDAKLPGSQSCSEKMAQIFSFFTFGARYLSGAGTLSLDEVFSPEQLVYDLEMRDHVVRIVDGLELDCDPRRAREEVLEGIRFGSFASLDSTNMLYKSIYWRPRAFRRGFLRSWIGAGSRTERDRAKDMVRERMRSHRYILEPELVEGLDRIYRKAEAELRNHGT